MVAHLGHGQHPQSVVLEGGGVGGWGALGVAVSLGAGGGGRPAGAPEPDHGAGGGAANQVAGGG